MQHCGSNYYRICARMVLPYLLFLQKQVQMQQAAASMKINIIVIKAIRIHSVIYYTRLVEKPLYISKDWSRNECPKK